MTDEALVEADRLEEDGRWEEAAVLRLTRDVGTSWYEVHTAEVWAGVWADVWGDERGLRVLVERYGAAGWGRCWFWSPGGWWTSTPRPHPPTTLGRLRPPVEQCPPDVRLAVEDAVRQALERRFGGTT